MCEDIFGLLIEFIEVGKCKKNELKFWFDCRNLKYKFGEMRVEFVFWWVLFMLNIFFVVIMFFNELRFIFIFGFYIKICYLFFGGSINNLDCVVYVIYSLYF